MGRVLWDLIVCRQKDVEGPVVEYYKRCFLSGELIKPPIAYFDKDKGVWIVVNGTHRIRALWEIIHQDNQLPVLPVASRSKIVMAITQNPPRFVNYKPPQELIIRSR